MNGIFGRIIVILLFTLLYFFLNEISIHYYKVILYPFLLLLVDVHVLFSRFACRLERRSFTELRIFLLTSFI